MSGFGGNIITPLATATRAGKVIPAEGMIVDAAGRLSVDGDFIAAHSMYGAENILNGGFETLGSPTFANWAQFAGTYSIISADPTIKHAGNYAAKLVHDTRDPTYAPQIITNTFTVVPGAQYDLSMWTRGDGTNAPRYGIYDITHGTFMGASAITTGVVVTTWTKVTISIVPLAGCVSMKIYLYAGTTNGATAYFDDVSMKQLVVTTIPPSRIKLPTEVTAVVGDTLQLYTRGIIEALDPYKEQYEFVSAVGNSYPRYWEYTPVVGDVGTIALTVNTMDTNTKVSATGATNIVVVNPTGQPTTNKNILYVGDSLADGKPVVQEVYRRLTQTGGSPAGLGYSNITFVGNKATTNFPTQKYVGYGGWTFGMYNGSSWTGYWVTATSDKDATDQHSIYNDSNGNGWYLESVVDNQIKMVPYLGGWTMPDPPSTLTWVSGGVHHATINYTAIEAEPSTPFWDSAGDVMSFTSFATNEGITGGIQALYVLLGWNGQTVPWPNMDNVDTSAAQTFINQFHADYPTAVVRLIGLQVPSITGGLGTNYGANSGYSTYYKLLRNAHALNAAYQALASSAPYSSFVKYIGLAQQFDSEYNMPSEATPVNVRSATTENRGNNGVHPLNPDGYYQIADAVFRDVIRTFCSQ